MKTKGTGKQRDTLSGKRWGGVTPIPSAYVGEEACFQAHQFEREGKLCGGRTRVDVRVGSDTYRQCVGDKSLGWHVEKLVTDCYGLRLLQCEAVGWPW